MGLGMTQPGTSRAASRADRRGRSLSDGRSSERKTHAGFLCGMEFGKLSDELEFFAQRGLHLDAVGTEVCLRPGEVLVFDNLALAHGRRGTLDQAN